MANKSYDEVGVLRILARNKSVNITGKSIEVDNTGGTAGNGTWGKIDYLVKVHNYNYTTTGSSVKHHYNPVKKDAIKQEKQNLAEFNNTKGKHPAKINMSNMIKSSMKSVSTK